jgi:hypothetical protein
MKRNHSIKQRFVRNSPSGKRLAFSFLLFKVTIRKRLVACPSAPGAIQLNIQWKKLPVITALSEGLSGAPSA